jgi:mono/diheme cytochrome c family protein
MEPSTPSAQESREKPEPVELHNPVPWLLIGLALIPVGCGAIQIAKSGLHPGPEFGDRRTLSALQAPSAAAPGTAPAADGATIYGARCAPCHQAAGTGLPGAFPPLAGSEYVKGADSVLIRILLHGIQGALTVGGTTYNGMMPPFKAQLADAEIAAVGSYVRSQWGNAAPPITAQSVAAQRTATASRSTPWNGDADLAGHH